MEVPLVCNITKHISDSVQRMDGTIAVRRGKLSIQSIRGEFVNNYFSSRNQQTQTNVAEDYFNCLIATSLWLTILFYP